MNRAVEFLFWFLIIAASSDPSDVGRYKNKSKNMVLAFASSAQI
jgi:hypothetical protein